MNSANTDLNHRAKRLNLPSPDPTVINSLPIELVIEILSRLPVLHLWSLRFVSKSWFNLITRNPNFAKFNYDHFTKLNNNPSILGLDHKNNVYLATDYTCCDEAIRLVSVLCQYYVAGICDGLICLVHKDNKEVCIVNPVMKEFSTVLCSPFPANRFPGYVKCIVFSFGFDQCSKKYKLVRTCCESYYPKKEYHSEISVYTLGVDSTWRVIEDDVKVGLDSRPESILVVNGVLHWLAKRPGSSVRGLIGGFDLKDEVFREVPPPSSLDMNDSRWKRGILELGGALSIFWRTNWSDCEIWMMEEYGVVNSWTRKYRFRLEAARQYLRTHALGITLDGGVLLIQNSEDLIMYDPETNSFANLKGFKFRLSRAYPYYASLISPRLITGACHAIAE
ncbi:hypothetical protein ACHQM5_009299 [Ranunculus cassubicifolius]